MPAANDLRRGMAIKYNGNAAIVLEVHHRTPGNLRAFVQAIIRYINTGKSADVRFGSTDKVELVEIERKQLEFSYKDRNGYHFMDPETYDTITLQENSDRRRQRLPGGKSFRASPLRRGQAGAGRTARLGGSEGDRIRGGIARRYGEQCDQAGDARDWEDHQRPALHQGRRNDQDRHPHRRLHGPRMIALRRI